MAKGGIITLDQEVKITTEGLKELGKIENSELTGTALAAFAQQYEQMKKDLELKMDQISEKQKENEDDLDKLNHRLIEIMGIFVAIFSALAIGGQIAVDMPSDLTTEDFLIRVAIIFGGLFLVIGGFLLILNKWILRQGASVTKYASTMKEVTNLVKMQIGLASFQFFFSAIIILYLWGLSSGINGLDSSMASLVGSLILTGVVYYVLIRIYAKRTGEK